MQVWAAKILSIVVEGWIRELGESRAKGHGAIPCPTVFHGRVSYSRYALAMGRHHGQSW